MTDVTAPHEPVSLIPDEPPAGGQPPHDPGTLTAQTPFKVLLGIGVVLILTLVVLLQTTAVVVTDTSTGVTYQANCGVGYALFGGPNEAVTSACGDAYGGRVFGLFFVIVLLAGVVTLLVSMNAYFQGKGGKLWAGIQQRIDGPVGSHSTGVADAAPLAAAPPRNTPEPGWMSNPDGPIPGADPSLAGGFRLALAQTPFRLFGGLALAFIVVMAIVLSPVTIETTDFAGDTYRSECGVGYHFFGGPTGEVTSACREAFAPKAVGGFLLLMALVSIGTMMFSIVQYWRGYQLGRLWEASNRWRDALATVGVASAVVAVGAIFLAGKATGPSTEVASGPFTPTDTFVTTTAPPINTDDDLFTQPTFASPIDVITTTPPRRTPVTARPRPTTTTTTTTTPPATTPDSPTTTTTTAPPQALEVEATSWYAASPSVVDGLTIPAGSLPVGSSGGADSKHAFFRLSGNQSTLVLNEDSSVGATQAPDQASIQACPVLTSNWDQVDNGSFEDEPDYSTSGCVPITRNGDGTWTVDLSSFPVDQRSNDKGFALVPASNDADWQVTLTVPA